MHRNNARIFIKVIKKIVYVYFIDEKKENKKFFSNQDNFHCCFSKSLNSL
ncbi:hypothetical protein ES705_04626 [subsurface metagenome]